MLIRNRRLYSHVKVIPFKSLAVGNADALPDANIEENTLSSNTGIKSNINALRFIFIFLKSPYNYNTRAFRNGKQSASLIRGLLHSIVI
jgi:hypothetical protein